MQKYKRLKLWLVIGMGVLPFTPLPMALQVALAVGIVVLLMALSAIARNPGTVRQGAATGTTSEGPPHRDRDEGTGDGADSGDGGGGD